jgi:protein SCO1/2
MRLTPAALALVLAACGSSSDEPAAARRYQLTGIVVERDSATGRIVVAHDPVKAFMPAMTMPFEVRGGQAVGPGDRILATLVVTDTRSWLDDVRVTQRAGEGPTSSRGRGGAAPGVALPPYPLTDQDGRALTLDRFIGRVLVVTFIYTRCPLPDFCPLMIRHLETLRRRAQDEGFGDRVALLGVTLDPAFDTPAVLRAYGASMLKGDDRFEHWTLATGAPGQIEDVARFFGVEYRTDQGWVTHSLTTAVVAHDGRIVRIFPSNSWRPEDLVEAVRSAAARVAAAARPYFNAGGSRWHSGIGAGSSARPASPLGAVLQAGMASTPAACSRSSHPPGSPTRS